MGRCVLPSKKNVSSRTWSASAKPASTSPKSNETSLCTFPCGPYSWMRESGRASASSIDISAGSTSYSTSISFSAASAVSSSSAATAATGSPTKRTLSGASACSSWLTGRMPNGIGSSLPTSVASTPGCAAARLTSMRLMRACGWGERRSFANAMRGNTRSSAKSVWPVTLAAASILASGSPITFAAVRVWARTMIGEPLSVLTRGAPLRVVSHESPRPPSSAPPRPARSLRACARRPARWPRRS